MRSRLKSVFTLALSACLVFSLSGQALCANASRLNVFRTGTAKTLPLYLSLPPSNIAPAMGLAHRESIQVRQSDPASILGLAQAHQIEVSAALAGEDVSGEQASSVARKPFELPARYGSSSETTPEASSTASPPPDGRLKPAASADRPLAGKTLLYIVSKTGGRDYLYDHMLQLSQEYGFDLLVLGYPDHKDYAVSRGIKPENYYSADVGEHSEANRRAIVERVQALSRTRRIDAVKTYLNAFAQLEAELAASLGVPGHAPEAVRAAHSKILARERMNASPDSSLHLPAFSVGSVQEAREAFLKIKAAGFERAVAKPDSGGGGWGVTLGIDSPEAAEAAFREIQDRIEALVHQDPRKARSKQLDQKPPVLFEAQIPDGLMLDVEIVVREGQKVFATTSYNPPALGNQERGTTYPAALPPEMRSLAETQALKALEAVGLKNGNAHVESILTLVGGKLAAPIVEINARMGGADVWASLLESSGLDAMREGLLAAFNLESRPLPKPAPVLLQHRFLISRTEGTLRAVRGLPAKEGDVFLSEIFVEPGAKVGARDLLGNVTVRGSDDLSSRNRLFELLGRIEIEIETPEGTIVRQTGLEGHDSRDGRMLAGDWVDRIDFERANWWGRLRLLPRSFHLNYVPAWVLNSMAQEVQAVALPLYTAALFDVPTALVIAGLGYMTRIAGAWMGSSIMARFNPKWVNAAAVFALALAGAPIPIAAALGSALFGTLLLNSIAGGLVYGTTRGVAENLLPRLIIGEYNPKKLELALNYAYQWVELACIATALLVAIPLLNALGGPAMMGVSSAVIALSAVLNAGIRFKEPWAKPATKAAEASTRPAPKEGSLGLADYIPYAFFRFMHFMVYGVLATMFALSFFAAPAAQAWVIGLYDGGSWLAGLLATLALMPADKTLGRTGWTLLGAAAAAAFVWSPFLHLPLLTFALGGLLGGLITINSNKWMSFYSDNLPEDRYRNLSKWMMTASILAMLPIFLAVSAPSLWPALGAVLSMSNILIGIGVAVSAAAALMAALLLKKK